MSPSFPVDGSPPESPASLKGKKVLVMGLGRFGGGVGVARWLVEQGADVTVNDAEPAEKLVESMKALAGLPIAFKLGGHHLDDFLAAELIVVNPAVDRNKSEVLKAAREIPTTTEMNLFVQRCRGITIGITGSVGKSTTTALIHEALKAGLGNTSFTGRVFLGGNIGRSLLLDLEQIGPRDFVVLELSSFMLEETPQVRWSPNFAIVTNVFPNHLDRHGTMDAYAAAKQNILRFQKPSDTAILNGDHEWVSRWAPLARGNVIEFTTLGPKSPVQPALLIPGGHNESNAAAAIALIDLLTESMPGFNRPAAVGAIAEFPGLAHRLQLVHTASPSPSRTIRFYNDSKATSPDASITAIRAFPPQSAIFIVGGYDKHIDLSPFEDLLARQAGGVIGIGATGAAITDHVRALAGPTAPRVENAGTLENAMTLAQRWALDDPQISAIVLSPASASWDQFPNYEVRGDCFSELARLTNNSA